MQLFSGEILSNPYVKLLYVDFLGVAKSILHHFLDRDVCELV